MFQSISGRYEKGSTIITTDQIYKRWSRIFNNDATIASAVLDRLFHHANLSAGFCFSKSDANWGRWTRIGETRIGLEADANWSHS